ALSVATAPLTVTQGSANSATSSFGSAAQVFPPLLNPERDDLRTVPQVWGRRRLRWTRLSGATIAGQPVYPVIRSHPAATTGSNGLCGLHFVLDGSAFELLFAGTDVRVTLIVNGRYRAPRLIQTTLRAGVAGAPLATPNSFVRFNLGTVAVRQVSVYARSSQGPCAIAVPASAQLQPWDRSREASFAAMADSYGGAFGPNWGVGGPFFEAAALLRIPHVDLDAIGGTGYAPNNANDMTRNPGNAFPARLPSNVDVRPDLFLTAGGINDNNAYAAPPLYATAADALAGFNAAVGDYYQRLRTALPGAVLAAVGPWAPRASTPTDPIARAKADTIKAALQAAGGLWIFLDNLDGSWLNSAGAAGAPTGPWQTGTGNVAAPAGDGNGDLYLLPDGVHPNAEGCLYLGTRIADGLRAALLAM
ncbi:MAG TPA: SGNH/GDSL hydrolase family protein, partial [Methylibium sp.]|nr:SGNH/GDSL hydrolase family protein [Methylibium sp.]